MSLPALHHVELSNGFRAFLLPRHTLPVVASTLWYRVGSRDERTGETGLSHFLEHMMFKGTDRYAKGEIDLLTAKLGGSNNAFTGHDTTAYYFALAAERWETALEIEASRMRNCALVADEFEAEKSVVLEEMSMGEDDPWQRLYHATERLCYQAHPYRHPIIGWQRDVSGAGVDDMRRYYERHYGPNRSFLVVCGDIDLNRTEARIGELFGDMPAAATREDTLAEIHQGGMRRAVERFTTTVRRMTITVATCRMGEDDDFGLDILSHVLGGTKNSRLYRSLVLDEQLATGAWVTNEVRLDPGLLCISVELREGTRPQQIEQVVHRELARLRDNGPTAGELRRARTQLRSAYLFEEETVLDVALRVGRFEATAVQGHRVLEGALERYDAVRGKHVRDLVARYLGPERWNVVWLIPEDARDDVETVAPTPKARRR